MRSGRIVFLIIAVMTVLYASMASGAVEKVMETKHLNDLAAYSGYLWIATDGGVIKYNTADDSHELFTVDQGLVNNMVTSVAVDETGTAWFGTYTGISAYDGESWTTYSKALGNLSFSDYISDVASGNDGNMYFGSLGGGLLKFDGAVWGRYGTYNGLTNYYVNTVMFGDDGMWVGTQEGMSHIFDGGSEKFMTLEGNTEATVEGIAPGYNGAVWAATWGGGLTCLHNDMWCTITAGDRLQSNYINTVTADQWGVKWIGTLGNGVTSISGSTWKTYDEIGGTPLVDVRAIAIDSNNVKWIGTADGNIWKIDIERPAPPSDITAECVSDGETRTVFLQWTKSPDDAGLTGYQIYRSTQEAYTEPFTPDIYANDLTRSEMEKTTSIHIGTVLAGGAEFQDAIDLDEGVYYYWVSASDDGLESEPELVSVTVPPIVSVDEDAPLEFSLGNAWPNPFNPTTTIDFTVAGESQVTLAVYNLGGQLIDVIHDGVTGAGTHAVTWNAAGRPSGLYFYRLDAGDYSATGKMLLLK